MMLTGENWKSEETLSHCHFVHIMLRNSPPKKQMSKVRSWDSIPFSLFSAYRLSEANVTFSVRIKEVVTKVHYSRERI
jgi:hypothetical protein